MTNSARIGFAAALLLCGATFAMAQNGPATDTPQRGGTPISMAITATITTTLDLAIGLERPTTFWAIPSHTMAPTDLGTTGGSKPVKTNEFDAPRIAA